MMKRFCFLTVCLLWGAASWGAVSVDIVPKPVKVAEREGRFVFDAGCVIVSDSEAEGRFLAEALAPATGLELPVVKRAGKGQKAVVMRLEKGLGKMGKEAYRLRVAPNGVRIEGATAAGLFYGVQTLLQLLPAEVCAAGVREADWSVPCVEVEDAPRFGWRGFMLDVARQFYTVDYVKSCLDWMAMYKLNVFHWHLTDDEGWRVEIKKHPELTETAAWRGPREEVPPVYGSGYHRYGGYYTQEEIREVVRYAAERHIMVMPEIEAPGHSRAIDAAFPELKCEYIEEGKHRETQNTWCVGCERGYALLGDILAEVAELFPCPYIHIGGDEVNKEYWENCRRCAAVKEREGLSNSAELQHYFITRVDSLVRGVGKRMGGWSEMMDGGELAAGTTVFSWIGIEHGIKAARKGLPVVMMPGGSCYLDMACTEKERGHYWAGLLPMERVYAFNPLVPDSLTPEERSRVLGVEAALWGEMADKPAWYAEYQLFPRLCAVAEVAWTPQEERDFGDFAARLERTHYRRLYEAGIRFRVPFPEVTYADGVLRAEAPYAGAVVRYTADGSEPTCFSTPYEAPIRTEVPERYRFRTFFTPHWGSIANGMVKRLYPKMSVETNIALHAKTKENALTDGDDGTIFMSARRVDRGDCLTFIFDEPLDCRKIRIETGVRQTSHYIATHAYAELSYDGKRFLRAGVLDIDGDIDVVCTMPVKSVRIVFTERQFEPCLVVRDLIIE